MLRTFLAAAALVALAAMGTAETEKPVSRIAMGSCVHQDRPQPIWDRILEFEPEVFLFLGDNVYGKDGDTAHLEQAYDQLAAQPGVQALFEKSTVLATWDDHDYGMNDAGGDYEHKEHARSQFLEFFRAPENDPRRTRQGIYDSSIFGPEGRRIQVILLDTRFNRSPLEREGDEVTGRYRAYLPTTAEGSTILGEEQWAWLAEQLRQPAELRLVVSSIQVIPDDHPFEKWANIPAERARLFELVKETAANGVVFISGDRHLAEVTMTDGGVGYPLYELTSSALTNSSPRWRPQETNRHRVATLNWGNNFGAVTVDWEQQDPMVRLQVIDDAGEVAIQTKFPLSTLQRGFLPPRK